MVTGAIMPSSGTKPRLQESSTFEIDESHHLDPQRPSSGNSNHSTLINGSSPSRLLNTARLGFTVLALCLAIVIVGTSADNLRVYNKTNLPREFGLPLWPYEMNIGPSVALVACGAIQVVTAVIAIAGAKISLIRRSPILHRALTLGTAFNGLLTSIIGTCFFYSINTSSLVASIQSWSCHWKDVDMLGVEPNFYRMCGLAETGLYSAVAASGVWFVVGVLGIMGVVRERASAKADIMNREGLGAEKF